jgi:hypothetical protein
MSYSLRVLALFLGAVLVAPLLIPAHAQPYERVVQDTVEGAPDRFAIETENGRVAVETWARDSVAFRARIVSSNAAAPVEQTRIDVDRTGPAMSLSTNYEDVEGRWSWGPSIYGYGTTTPRVLYTVVVPRSAAVAIEGQETDVEVTGLRARLRIDTQEGRTQVTDQAGSVQLDAQEGTVALQAVEGDVIADVQEGDVRMEELAGAVDLEMQEGEASLEFTSFDGGAIDVQEASVAIALPPEQGFTLSADLGEAAALNSPLDLSGLRNDEGDYNGDVRGGGPLLQVDAMEGTITIR